MKYLALCGFSFLVVSCSSISGIREDRGNQIERRSVPINIRGAMGLRKRLLVLPFLDTAAYRGMKVTEAARKAYITSVARSGKFVLIPPTDLPKSIESYKKNNEYDLEAIAKIAKQLDVSAIVEGKILEIKAQRIGDQVGLFRKVKARMTASVHVRVVAAKNSKELLSEVRTATVETSVRAFGKRNYSSKQLEENPKLVQAALRKAFNGSLHNFIKSVEKLDWNGRVAKISGDRIFINAGRLTGLQVGDILRVTEPGQEIFDPDTGVFIGLAPGRTKGTIEVVNYFGRDGSVAVIHSGSGFQQNDQVEIY